MDRLSRKSVRTTSLPIKVLQFGEGNFLRAFADWVIDMINETNSFNAGVAVVQPIENGIIDLMADQDGLYHILIRGLEEAKAIDKTRLVSCIQKTINPFKDPSAYFDQALNPDLKIVISNTTESGIQFNENDIPMGDLLANTFPGKLTQLLKKRFDHFKGNPNAGLVFIPCELIENNGVNLKNTIESYIKLWNLGADFEEWINKHNHFANTLVDRIVPGFPKEEIDEIRANIGFNDQLVVCSELFYLWVIQGSEEVQKAFPADIAGLNVKFVKDITPYRTRKVRILNGAHTCIVPIGLLDGIETIRESVEHEILGKFITDTLDREISTTINLPADELSAFSAEVIERFKNPFIRHELKSISLNSIAKFKVRVLPSIKDYFSSENELPKRLVFSLACLIKLYTSNQFEINDDYVIKLYFNALKSNYISNDQVFEILSKTEFWGEDLNAITGMTELVISYITLLARKSSIDAINELI